MCRIRSRKGTQLSHQVHHSLSPLWSSGIPPFPRRQRPSRRLSSTLHPPSPPLFASSAASAGRLCSFVTASASMPTCRRKRVVLTQPSNELLECLKTNPKRDVFFLKQTGEIFETYELRALPCVQSFSNLPQGICRTYVLLPVKTVPM